MNWPWDQQGLATAKVFRLPTNTDAYIPGVTLRGDCSGEKTKTSFRWCRSHFWDGITCRTSRQHPPVCIDYRKLGGNRLLESVLRGLGLPAQGVCIFWYSEQLFYPKRAELVISTARDCTCIREYLQARIFTPSQILRSFNQPIRWLGGFWKLTGEAERNILFNH